MQLISPISEYRRDQPVRVSLFLIYHVAGESVLRTTSSTEYSVLQIVFCWLIPDRVHQPQNKLHHGLQGPQGWRILGGKDGDLKSGKYIETHRQSAPSLSWSQNTSWRLRFIFWSVNMIHRRTRSRCYLEWVLNQESLGESIRSPDGGWLWMISHQWRIR